MSGVTPFNPTYGAGISPLKFGPFSGGEVSFDRQWFIETQGDEHGYSIGVIGSLTPDDWFNLTDIVDRLFVDGSSDVAVLESSVTGQWNGELDVTVQIEGYGDIILNWNGATAYVLIDPVFTAYVIANVGNTLGVNILPRPLPSTRNIITTLSDLEITTLGDNIIHTG